MHAMMLLCSTVMMAAPERGPEPVAPLPDQAYVTKVNRAARGFGLGYGNGLWGQGFGQRLHLDIPFGRRVGQFFGLRVQGTFVHSPGGVRYDPVAFGGLELFGRSPVIGGVVRMYGGGGVFAGGRPLPSTEGREWGIAGGGHFGIEAFLNPRMAFAVEVGGQGPVHGLGMDSGASVMGLMNFYFGR